MPHHSNVYGYIQFDLSQQDAYASNMQSMNTLPSVADNHLLWRGMFNASVRPDADAGLIHFAACYHGIEYEWEYWISQFQAMLQCLKWDSATVHLDTLFSGSHTFHWENESADINQPPQVRCEWVRESSFQ